MNLERGKSYLLIGSLSLTRSFGCQLIVTYGDSLNLKRICILNLEDSKDLGVDIQFHYLLIYKLACPFEITMIYEEAELEELELNNFDLILIHGYNYVEERKKFLSIFKRFELAILATTQYSEVLMKNFDYAIKLKHSYTKDERSNLSCQMLKPFCDNKVRIKGKFYHFYHYNMLN